jgi:hypothetical protein
MISGKNGLARLGASLLVFPSRPAGSGGGPAPVPADSCWPRPLSPPRAPRGPAAAPCWPDPPATPASCWPAGRA